MRVWVSVTTTKARLGVFFYSLQSLKAQDYRNYDIVVHLSKEPYLLDEGVTAIPDWMKGENVGVRFIKNSGSYRKLIPLIQSVSSDDIVVTVDDDVLYSRDWLARMIENALEHPDSVVCARARRIEKNRLDRYQNYANWPLIQERAAGLPLLPIGCSGVAYRSKLLDLEFAGDGASHVCAPTADDIWFRLSSLLKNTRVYVDPGMDEGNAYVKHSVGLEYLNLHQHQFDRPLFVRESIRVATRVKDYFGVPVSSNDYAWKNSLELLRARGRRIDL